MAKRLAGVKFTGLDTFMDELRTLAADLTEEANGIMVKSAFEAADEIRAAYPFVSGGLRDGVVVIPSQGVLLAGAELRNNAPHAYIYEHGTGVRQNKAGANRGRMHGRPTFEPIAHAFRRSAITSVIFRIYQHGASSVTRDDEAA